MSGFQECAVFLHGLETANGVFWGSGILWSDFGGKPNRSTNRVGLALAHKSSLKALLRSIFPSQTTSDQIHTK